MTPMQRWLTLLASALWCAAGCGTAAPEDVASATSDFSVMDTQGRIIVYADTSALCSAAREAAMTRTEAIAALLNRYDPASELSAVNRAAGGPPVPVSRTTARAIADAKRLCRLSGGAFNPLVGSLVGLWKRCEAEQRLPTEEEIGSALRVLNIDDVEVAGLEGAAEGRATCRLARTGMQLDLGGMAKGWAAQEAMAKIRRCRGVRAALVNLGGDGVCWSEGDRGADGAETAAAGGSWRRPWRFGVQDPRSAGRRVLLPLEVAGAAAVVTSGNYYRYWEIGGRRYSHILDPRTGQPVDSAVVSATVIHPDGGTADALATACMVLGVRDAMALLERLPGAEGLILEASEGGLRPHPTAGFARYGRVKNLDSGPVSEGEVLP